MYIAEPRGAQEGLGGGGGGGGGISINVRDGRRERIGVNCVDISSTSLYSPWLLPFVLPSHCLFSCHNRVLIVDIVPCSNNDRILRVSSKFCASSISYYTSFMILINFKIRFASAKVLKVFLRRKQDTKLRSGAYRKK